MRRWDDVSGARFPAVGVGDDVGGFTVEGLLGAGGCGVVYRARRGGELFALKLQSLEAMGRWPEREATLLMRVRHPNVVGFRGCGLYPDKAPRCFFLAMEHVEGRTLHRWVEEENPGARRAAELLRGLARGLAPVHAEGALHRDLKETNAMVRASDGEPVLVDFGVGDYAGAPRLTQGVLPPGTPRYRSPEALAFRRDGPRPGGRYEFTAADDVYALGVVFFWVLTARYPFHDVETPPEVEAVIREVPPAPHALNPRVPQVLSALCLRLLSKRPEDRGGARELGEALEAALAGAGPDWEVPLCEAWEDAPAALQAEPASEAEAVARWIEEGQGGGVVPRRGRRGEPEAVEAGRVDVTTVVTGGAPSEGARAAAGPVAGSRWGLGRGLLRGALLLGGVALGGLGAWLVLEAGPPGSGRPRSGVEAGREVAREGASPEIGRAAPPPSAVPTAAAAAPGLAPPQKEEPPVKTPPDAAAPPSTATRVLKAVARTATAGALCTGLSCAGTPQVRPPPPGAPCPEGALESMKALGIKPGDRDALAFKADGSGGDEVTVGEGEVRMTMAGDFGEAFNGGEAAGQLILGKRVYGRFTTLYNRDGEAFPVCLELRDRSLALGIPREPGDTGGTSSARVQNVWKVVAVKRFQ